MSNNNWWKIKHDWWIEDLKFEYDQKSELVELLRKHPEDKMGDCFRSMIKCIDKRIDWLRKEYKKIYGVYPKRKWYA